MKRIDLAAPDTPSVEFSLPGGAVVVVDVCEFVGRLNETAGASDWKSKLEACRRLLGFPDGTAPAVVASAYKACMAEWESWLYEIKDSARQLS